MGQNFVEPGCPNFNHDEQGGAGGNAGAVVFDGLNDEGNPYVICGSVFRNNAANELGGALFRTPNAGKREMQIEHTTTACSSTTSAARPRRVETTCSGPREMRAPTARASPTRC